MDNLKKILEVLNDLIRINKDREEGYTKVGRELTPAEHNLRSAFERKAQESRNNIVQLELAANEIHDQLEDRSAAVEGNSPLTGRIYKLWSEVKDFFTGKDPSSVLKSCADGEEKAKYCYEDALHDVDLPENLHELLVHQKEYIDSSKQEISLLMDEEKQNS
jgi:uncharacterized protein (TIGR02284 family)